MEIVKLENIETIKDKKTFIKITLNAQNITDFPIKILTLQKQGFSNFIISYDRENPVLSMTKTLELVMPKVLKLISLPNLTIGFQEFPKCIYERNILRPKIKDSLHNSLPFINSKTNLEKPELCKECTHFDSCSGVSEKYLKTFSPEELKPIPSNTKITQKNLKKTNSFRNLQIKEASEIILNDLNKEKDYMRKFIVYVKSHPKRYSESSKERIVYYIYNHQSDFKQTYRFLKNLFKEYDISKIEEYLKDSNMFAISFAIMGNSKLRKTFYFTINHLNPKQLSKLLRQFNITQMSLNYPIWGFGIDSSLGKISNKIYYSINNSSPQEIEEFIKEFPQENKRKLQKFIQDNSSNIKSILLDLKLKNGKMYSKKIEFAIHDNKYDLSSIYPIFGQKFVRKIELYSVCFEIYMLKEEKINLYYSLA